MVSPDNKQWIRQLHDSPSYLPWIKLLIATNMAVLLRDPSGAEYAHSEQELQDRILTIFGTNENDEHLFRYLAIFTVQYQQATFFAVCHFQLKFN